MFWHRNFSGADDVQIDVAGRWHCFYPLLYANFCFFLHSFTLSCMGCIQNIFSNMQSSVPSHHHVKKMQFKCIMFLGPPVILSSKVWHFSWHNLSPGLNVPGICLVSLVCYIMYRSIGQCVIVVHRNMVKQHYLVPRCDHTSPKASDPIRTPHLSVFRQKYY